MSKIRLLLAPVLAFGLFAMPAVAFQENQTDAGVQALVNAIRSNRKALVAANLGLTDREAESFWPIYDRYMQEIGANGNRLVDVIGRYVADFNGLSDEKATKLVEDYLAVDADRIKLRSAYLKEFATCLSGRKLARFYQIENKMDAVLRYDLASTIPVLEEKSPAPAK
jgi:hypothetical protein